MAGCCRYGEVAVVERWPLVEVQLYLNKILSFTNVLCGGLLYIIGKIGPIAFTARSTLLISGCFGLAENETNEDEDTIHLSPQDSGVLCLR